MNKILGKIKHFIILFLVFIAPFSFFPFLQTLLPINILYVFAFGSLLLLLISFLQLLTSKKLVLQSNSLDIPIVVFLGVLFISFITSATNKMQAFLNPYFGLLMMVSLVVLYFYLSRMGGAGKGERTSPLRILSLSGFVISAFIILLSLEPTKGIGVIPLELLIFIGFTFMYSLGSLVRSFSAEEESPKVVQICMLILISLALVISLVTFSKQQVLFPSFSLSLKAMAQIVKNPLTALLGVGIDNYSSVFTHIKDIAYNQTNLWQISAPSVDRSALSYIVTTAGIAGFISFLFLLFSLIKNIKKDPSTSSGQVPSIMLGSLYLLCTLVIFPPSFLVFFLLFLLASQTGKNNKEYIFSFSKSFSLYSYLIIIITACVFFGFAVRYLSSLALADYFYTQSFVGIKENKLNKVYENQKKALSNNPYLEQYHIDFSKTHLMIAGNIMDKAASSSADTTTQSNSQKTLTFTKESKQALVEVIQIAITETQTAIDLNPKKAEYWANLAQIYTIIPKELQAPNEKDANSPQAAAILYFKKALELDSNNPAYYIQISQVYIAQKKAEEAMTYVKKAIEIKPNWADAHYQLAMLYGEKKDKENMTKELELTLANLDPKTNQKEYDATKQILDKIKSQQSGGQTGVQPASPQNGVQPGI